MEVRALVLIETARDKRGCVYRPTTIIRQLFADCQESWSNLLTRVLEQTPNSGQNYTPNNSQSEIL